MTFGNFSLPDRLKTHDGATIYKLTNFPGIQGNQGQIGLYKSSSNDVVLTKIYSNQDSFERERRIITSLQRLHPNIPKVDTYGFTSGKNFLALTFGKDFVEDPQIAHSKIVTLENVLFTDISIGDDGNYDLIRELRMEDPSRKINRALNIAKIIKDVHVMGVVHRDLKPSQIIFVQNRDGSISEQVIDFGFGYNIEEENFEFLTKVSTPLYAFELELYADHLKSNNGVAVTQNFPRHRHFFSDTYALTITLAQYLGVEPSPPFIPDLQLLYRGNEESNDVSLEDQLRHIAQTRKNFYKKGRISTIGSTAFDVGLENIVNTRSPKDSGIDSLIKLLQKDSDGRFNYFVNNHKLVSAAMFVTFLLGVYFSFASYENISNAMEMRNLDNKRTGILENYRSTGSLNKAAIRKLSGEVIEILSDQMLENESRGDHHFPRILNFYSYTSEEPNRLTTGSYNDLLLLSAEALNDNRLMDAYINRIKALSFQPTNEQGFRIFRLTDVLTKMLMAKEKNTATSKWLDKRLEANSIDPDSFYHHSFKLLNETLEFIASTRFNDRYKFFEASPGRIKPIGTDVMINADSYFLTVPLKQAAMIPSLPQSNLSTLYDEHMKTMFNLLYHDGFVLDNIAFSNSDTLNLIPRLSYVTDLYGNNNEMKREGNIFPASLTTVLFLDLLLENIGKSNGAYAEAASSLINLYENNIDFASSQNLVFPEFLAKPDSLQSENFVSNSDYFSFSGNNQLPFLVYTSLLVKHNMGLSSVASDDFVNNKIKSIVPDTLVDKNIVRLLKTMEFSIQGGLFPKTRIESTDIYQPLILGQVNGLRALYNYSRSEEK